MSDESKLREAICRFGHLLYMRGYAHGSTGNISARTDDGIIVTPTNSCLGLLDPAQLSKVADDGKHVSGDPPSKEAFLHLSMYQERTGARGIVHLHCTHAVAVSCRCHEDTANVLPPLTAYYAMRIGKLPLIPYYRPGDRKLADAVREQARTHSAVLLANHGPVVAGKTLEDAVFSAEELEETARLSLLLEGKPVSLLTDAQLADLQAAFPS
jgi:ribulose-5-phosphate 4-epimerase/fuculose-1-phosphate aldolase